MTNETILNWHCDWGAYHTMSMSLLSIVIKVTDDMQYII